MTGALLALLMMGTGENSAEAPRVSSAVDLAAKWGIVTSVKRSRERNRAVGGAPNSFHLSGRAIDIARRPGVRHEQIEAAFREAGYALLESLDEGDHSHFAFELRGLAPAASSPTPATDHTRVAASSCEAAAPLSRRRPDRTDDCGPALETSPSLSRIGAGGD